MNRRVGQGFPGNLGQQLQDYGQTALGIAQSPYLIGVSAAVGIISPIAGAALYTGAMGVGIFASGVASSIASTERAARTVGSRNNEFGRRALYSYR